MVNSFNNTFFLQVWKQMLPYLRVLLFCIPGSFHNALQFCLSSTLLCDRTNSIFGQQLESASQKHRNKRNSWRHWERPIWCPLPPRSFPAAWSCCCVELVQKQALQNADVAPSAKSCGPIFGVQNSRFSQQILGLTHSHFGKQNKVEKEMIARGMWNGWCCVTWSVVCSLACVVVRANTTSTKCWTRRPQTPTPPPPRRRPCWTTSCRSRGTPSRLVQR